VIFSFCLWRRWTFLHPSGGPDEPKSIHLVMRKTVEGFSESAVDAVYFCQRPDLGWFHCEIQAMASR
jgi:hypothetical protein